MTTRLSDIIIPQLFDKYTLLASEVKTNIINSGAVARNGRFDQILTSETGGTTFTMPSYGPLDATIADNVADDDPTVLSVANKITAIAEIQVKMFRTAAWGAASLVYDEAGADPMMAIVQQAAKWWRIKKQIAVISTLKGVFANNDTVTDPFHTQGDMTLDVSNVNGGTYLDGTTNFTTDSFIKACATMGDSMGELQVLLVHSVVKAALWRQQMIDFIPDALNLTLSPTAQRAQGIGTEMFQNLVLVTDDSLPTDGAGVYTSYLLGNGALQLGEAVPASGGTAVQFYNDAGNGRGEERLFQRFNWIIHPVGYAYVGAGYATGGPSNAATTGNLAHQDSWKRVFPARKYVKMARLITKEHA